MRDTGELIRAELLYEIRRYDRKLARDLREATQRTIRAVHSAVRSHSHARGGAQRTAKAIAAAWRAPPRPKVRAGVRAHGSSQVIRERLRRGTVIHEPGGIRSADVQFTLTNRRAEGRRAHTRGISSERAQRSRASETSERPRRSAGGCGRRSTSAAGAGPDQSR